MKMAASLGWLVAVLSLIVVASCVDPEVRMDAMQLIESKGYPAERHYVTTSDGYILQMHRIPYSKNSNKSRNTTRPVFFLQHGLLCSSTNWITNLANESFAFILSDAGFDVWMGNVRGNTYGRNHTHLTVHDRAFWNFTFDEHSLSDLPAMLDEVMHVTGQEKMFYAGHSQGTVMGFAGFTANKTLAKHIQAFFALAPVTTVQYIDGLFALSQYLYKELEFLFDTFGKGEFVPHDELIQLAAEYVCPDDIIIEEICRDVIFLICGYDVNNLNLTRIPVYYSHTPAGTSVKNVVHYSQEVISGYFRKYDYGKEGNMMAYGVPEPPNYNVSELGVPTALFSGLKDYLADPKDVARLVPEIENVVFNHTTIDYYEHLDFIWGLDARFKVYDPIIEMTKRFL